MHSSFSCAKAPHLFLYGLFFSCTFSCHVLSTGSIWEVEFIALFLLCQFLLISIVLILEIIMSELHIDVGFCAVLSNHSIDSRVNSKFTSEFSKAVICVYIGQIPVARVLPSMGLGNFRESEGRQCFLQSLRWSLITWFTSDFTAVSVTAKEPGANGTMCYTHSETAKFLAVLQSGISFQNSLRPNCTP